VGRKTAYLAVWENLVAAKLRNQLDPIPRCFKFDDLESVVRAQSPGIDLHPQFETVDSDIQCLT
jgi:hypothetical protein